jgi:copper chaperone CopZ
METALQKVDGVAAATISFVTQKMKVTFAEGADPSAVMPEVLKACRKVERDVEIKF